MREDDVKCKGRIRCEKSVYAANKARIRCENMYTLRNKIRRAAHQVPSVSGMSEDDVEEEMKVTAYTLRKRAYTLQKKSVYAAKKEHIRCEKQCESRPILNGVVAGVIGVGDERGRRGGAGVLFLRSEVPLHASYKRGALYICFL